MKPKISIIRPSGGFRLYTDAAPDASVADVVASDTSVEDAGDDVVELAEGAESVTDEDEMELVASVAVEDLDAVDWLVTFVLEAE